jgi:hypothetical protein
MRLPFQMPTTNRNRRYSDLRHRKAKTAKASGHDNKQVVNLRRKRLNCAQVKKLMKNNKMFRNSYEIYEFSFTLLVCLPQPITGLPTETHPAATRRTHQTSSKRGNIDAGGIKTHRMLKTHQKAKPSHFNNPSKPRNKKFHHRDGG